jgi:hypothetical protein
MEDGGWRMDPTCRQVAGYRQVGRQRRGSEVIHMQAEAEAAGRRQKARHGYWLTYLRVIGMSVHIHAYM